MKKTSVSAALAVLWFHTAVLAQQSPPPPDRSAAGTAPAAATAAPPPASGAPATAPATAPAPPPPAYPSYPYGPPPGYGTPPPPPPPQPLPPSYYYYQPPAPTGVWRPFTISLGLGMGLLSSPGAFADDSRDNDGSLNYLVRLGFGVTRDWVVFVGVDGASVSTVEMDMTVTNYLLGAQYFIARRFYLRGGLGLATFSEETVLDDYSTAGQGFLAAAGVELVQGENVAFGLEYAAGLSRFSGGSYLSNGIVALLSFY